MTLFMHFGHEHPLILNGERGIDEEINRDHQCYICGLPILLSAFYSCSVTSCKYFLHEPCAVLPQNTSHFLRKFYGRFKLVKHDGKCYCQKCHKECKNLHYRDANLDWHIHPLCLIPREIKSKHKSHPSHPLVAFCRDTSEGCDACGLKQNGHFFWCQPCGFWIHVDCALLPRFLKCTNHEHPLILSNSNEIYVKCGICFYDLAFEALAYLCGICKGHFHVRCVAENREDFGAEVEIIDLPFDDHHALWSWIIKNLQKLNSGEGSSTYDHNLLHEHGLILFDEDGHDVNSIEPPYTSQELVCCNTCIQPIYPPFYACPKSESGGCFFHLHQQCAQLPSYLKNPMVDNLLKELCTWWSTERLALCSMFRCFYCGLPGSGSNYVDRFSHCIACLSAPEFIKHESHGQHVLYYCNLALRRLSRKKLSCCSISLDRFMYCYGCVDCDFRIHIHCALLPKRVEHRFDIHPLSLITTSIIKDAAKSTDDYLCEFCEEVIDTSYWYYGCEECDNFFHIKCIPSVGNLSRVKFGSSVTVSCHPHRVAFVRMLGYGSQKCGYCKKTTQGFVDDMAFHCSECDFWMHFKCVEECTGYSKHFAYLPWK